MKNNTIAFIGAGNMARSLIHGLIADGFSAEKIWATNPVLEPLQDMKSLGINVTHDNHEGAKQADVLIFCVKPQILKTVASKLAETIQQKNPLVISIAAGVRESDLQHWLGGKTAIVRCMPNTPALVGSGATGLYANSKVSTEQKSLAEAILRAVGITVWLEDEKLLDVVTALSGSGPAYFFLIMEALENAATELGLPRDVARTLTLQTALGSARMAFESTQSLEKLRQQVTSPGGTTERALQVLTQEQLPKILADAVKAANKRADELGTLLGTAA